MGLALNGRTELVAEAKTAAGVLRHTGARIAELEHSPVTAEGVY